jgi:glyoxylase-like metal-dependent hydrolase (beta-lactamase superfamily II)
MKAAKIGNIWKFTGEDDVNCYFLVDRNIMIDSGNRNDAAELESEFRKIADPDSVKTVLFTHLHYDHAGNFRLFKNAQFYASHEEIDDFKKCAPFYPDKELFVKIKPFPQIDAIKIILTPGHTHGSVCILLEKENILFTGDTYFRKGVYGRDDFANSDPEKLPQSIKTIEKMKAKIMPGHDY